MNSFRMTTLACALALALSACGARPRSAVDLRFAPRRGPKSAPIEIVVYSDFQCGFCKQAARELERLWTLRPNRVKIYYKHCPLSYHPQARNAAKAAEAALRQGKFWEMHDLLFAYAAELNDAIYPQLAAQLGLDAARFSADFNSFEVNNRILADLAEGDAIGVSYTPYFLVNRTPFRGSANSLVDQVLHWP